MTNTLKTLNEFVVSFLNNNEDTTDDGWLSSATQGNLKKLLNKVLKCGTQKDPNFPKRGKSAYLFFCSAMRDKVKASLSADAKATDVTRELGVQWNALKDDKSRAKELGRYASLAATDKARYDSERSEYVPDENFTNKRRVKKLNTGPKRAKSAYLFFCSDKRDEVKASLGDGASATDVTRQLGVRWNALKAKNCTNKYDVQALEDKDRYYREKDEASGSAPAKKKAPAKKEEAPAKKEEAPAKKEEAPAKKKAPTKKK